VTPVAEGPRRFGHAEPACFALVASVYLAHFWRSGYDRFYHDAQGYWDGGKLFGEDGAFSLYAFDDPIRGYALPFFNFLLQTVAGALDVDDVTIVRVSGALLAATLGVVVAPRLARAIFPGADTSWPRVLAFNGLLFVLWRDHFQFPLSDFPTLLAAGVGVIGLLRRTTAGYVVAGVGFGLAANMRPAYVPVAFIALVSVWLFPRAASMRGRATATALVAVPLILVSLPQLALNQHHRGEWSPVTPAPPESTLGFLTWGLQAQRHETYVGSPEAYPQALVFYLDPTTRSAAEDADLPFDSFEQYARIVLGNPIAITANYSLHVFNGLDVRYVTPYIRDLEDRPLVLPFLQFTLLFLAGTQLALPGARRRLGAIRWTGIALLLGSTLVSIPGPMTPRYLLGVHLLAYILVCFSPALRETVAANGIARRLSVGLSYAAFVLTCLLLSTATQRQIEHELGDATGVYLRSRISSGPARATTTNPSSASSGLTSGSARRAPSSPVKIVPTCCPGRYAT
jgi:hypothetical protein